MILLFVGKQSIEGRPPYNPKDLLKLFLYGYLNSMRSSRVLEKQCHINIEVMWLLKQLTPDHNTIANFRRDNSKASRKVFRHTVSIAKSFNLIAGEWSLIHIAEKVNTDKLQSVLDNEDDGEVKQKIQIQLNNYKKKKE